MKLNDLRKLAVKRQALVRFSLSNSLSCVVDNHGIARIPGLSTIPDFNLEDELSRAQEFYWEVPDGAEKPKRMARKELEGLAVGASTSEPVDHHDE